ncbi:MAG: 2-C-methyl-D-erythritol 2,4-cyclodiphosphate synthase, partial [Bacteroidota bacterium]
MNIRVGIGYDVHRLEEACSMIIGGVNIPFEKGLHGHS